MGVVLQPSLQLADGLLHTLGRCEEALDVCEGGRVVHHIQGTRVNLESRGTGSHMRGVTIHSNTGQLEISKGLKFHRYRPNS